MLSKIGAETPSSTDDSESQAIHRHRYFYSDSWDPQLDSIAVSAFVIILVDFDIFSETLSTPHICHLILQYEAVLGEKIITSVTLWVKLT